MSTIDLSRRHWIKVISGLLFNVGLIGPYLAIAQTNSNLSQEEIIRLFVDAILPADELTPAASALNVHTQILKDATHNPALALLITNGCEWINQSFTSFTSLDSRQMERLLLAMSKAEWDTGPRNFYHEIRDRAVMYYYADPKAWAGSVINRPPQPIGYPEVINR